MGRRGRYTEVNKQEILRRLERSGLTPADFVKKIGFPALPTLLGWVRGCQAKPNPFLPVRVHDSAVAPTGQGVRLAVGEQTLTFDARDVSPAWVASLLRSLQ